eukprot:CAMPEP_0167805302 /NCGR_PEP_ID=MMETSP0111_2-20121227/21095_1 /TAXON_ID=91324 /ORGANISM="Lotharella globosa, Strain CCCM811" /LENGTH=66 /DNA_ID=CAMNT_0007702425 /DNA_START=88 /DNA_END=288 /DNA_ORIENTATION=-
MDFILPRTGTCAVQTGFLTNRTIHMLHPTRTRTIENRQITCRGTQKASKAVVRTLSSVEADHRPHV